MSNQIRQSFTSIKKILLRRQREVQEEIKRVVKDDPLLSDGLAESTEPGTESWLAEVHGKAVAVKDNLQSMLVATQKALKKIKKGNFGKCENCGKMIEEARLQAMPTATLCISCSKKK
jgi:DnaK suppressor protein